MRYWITKPGIDIDCVARTEIDHFGNGLVCGALVDMRDLGQLLAHIHNQEIETVDIAVGSEHAADRMLMVAVDLQ
ncbi:MAG: hypothetical protein JWP25_8033 [Bradyrhizobium sp.]|jgi:hypothetical protein|nr:hypothetical protein [Bradyrhizobium sp.]